MAALRPEIAVLRTEIASLRTDIASSSSNEVAPGSVPFLALDSEP
jgi:hypothetical protein